MYLLEKSRVVYQEHDERNYHVFYLLLHGSSSANYTQRYHLPFDISQYNYLNQSNCVSIPDLNESEAFQEFMQSIRELDFTPDEIDDLFRVVAIVLHLGNIRFKPSIDGEGSLIENTSILCDTPVAPEGSVASQLSNISPEDHLACVASLSGTSPTSLGHSLTFKKIQSARRRSITYAPLRVDIAKYHCSFL